MTTTNKYFFIKNNKTRWFLGIDDKFSAWNFVKTNAKRLNTQEEVDAKLTALNLDKEDVTVMHVEVRDLLPSKRDLDV